jgi:alpha-tubulin suppressor-like RCC1 family protein
MRFRHAAWLALLAAGCHLLIDPESVPVPAPKELIYADASYVIGISVDPHAPSTRGVPIDTFTSDPQLPLGLSFDREGAVTGTPLAIAPPALYQVTATNDAGSTTGLVELSVSAGEIAGLSALSASGDHTCVALNGDRVLCWGENHLFQLGDGNNDPARFPVMSAGAGPGIQAIASGDYHVCALAGGAASCWGVYYDGVPDSGAWTSAPRVVAGGETGVQAVAAGTNHSCLVVSGGVQCWGANDFGQLGDGTQEWRTAPTQVLGLTSGATEVVAGTAHSCAVVGGGVQCWGSNIAGQLGDSLDGGIHAGPFAVSRLPAGVQAVAAGGSHTCAIADGGAYCWGSNIYGELGIGTVSSTALPTAVKRLGPVVTAIATGENHTCAIAGGGAWCWGRNDHGQLGFDAGAPQTAPQPVPGLSSGVQAIAAGAAHTCAVVAGGVQCWGDDQFGQTGNGTTAPGSPPSPVYFGGP